MQRDTSAFQSATFDLIVIGGGIFGVCAAWDAALRGLSVALLEKSDFSGATSNNHLRMIHGGIRYLQHGDVARIRESVRERRALMRIAPHLVEPLPIVIPTYGHGMRGREVLQAGMALYDLVSLDRNRGVRDPQRRIPPGRILSRIEVLRLFPRLEQHNLTGGALFHDGQIYHPARLALAFLKSAVQAGAVAGNYLEARQLLQEDGRISGVRACDRVSEAEFDIRGRVVLNATGPWSPELIGRFLGEAHKPPLTFSRDACFVVKRPILGQYALAVQGQTHDPDTLMSRGARHLFIVPWQEYTLVGVWHVVHQDGPERFTVSERELHDFVEEVNLAYPAAALTLDDISRWMAGLVLFGEKQVSARNLRYGKRSAVIDHGETDGLPGLISMVGVRATTARGVAQQAVDLAFEQLGFAPPACVTEWMPVHGGEHAAFDRLRREAERQRPEGFHAMALVPALRHHGSAYHDLFQYQEEEPALGEALPGSHTTGAAVVHAVRQEMALNLEDVVFRRTDIGSGSRPADVTLSAAAHIMARELGWTASTILDQITKVSSRFLN